MQARITTCYSRINLERITRIFIGSSYKKEGSYCFPIFTLQTYGEIIKFFKNYFNINEIVELRALPLYDVAYEYLSIIVRENLLQSFVTIILNDPYFMMHGIVDRFYAIDEFNILFEKINLKFKYIDDNQTVLALEIKQDIYFLTEGGFCKIYYYKHLNCIKKVLKSEFVDNPRVVARFRQEFDIMKSINDSIVAEVYDFNEADLSYTMKYYTQPLDRYVLNKRLSNKIKILLIMNILNLFVKLHELGYYHRDIKPQNMYVENTLPVIADFGLGKDIYGSSLNTSDTKYMGTPAYTDPEVLTNLSCADEMSEVYSLGRLINFIMTRDPENFDHAYRAIADRATAPRDKRFKSVEELRNALYISEERDQYFFDTCSYKIQEGEFDDYVLDFIYELTKDEFLNFFKEHCFLEAVIEGLTIGSIKFKIKIRDYMIHIVSNNLHKDILDDFRILMIEHFRKTKDDFILEIFYVLGFNDEDLEYYN